MMTIEQIIDKMEDRNLSYIARKLKVTPAYLALIKKRRRLNPSYEMVKKLSDYFEEQRHCGLDSPHGMD